MLFLLQGIFIGLLFGVPAGAVGAMTVQRTLRYGVRAGLVTGLGSSVVDCFYACIGAFGLTLISDILLKGQMVIRCVGGFLIAAMGIGLLLRKENEEQTIADTRDFMKMFFSSFAVGITNPAAILTFLLAFSWFGITGEAGWKNNSFLVFGVFIGTYLWWGALSIGTDRLKRRAKKVNFEKINRVFGTILSILGIVILVEFCRTAAR